MSTDDAVEQGRQRDRVYIEREKHHIYQAWGKDDDTSAFAQLADVVVFTAALGYRAKRRVPIRVRQHVGFWRTFSPQDDVPFIQALAIAATGNPAVVADQGQMLTVLEEYSNGGVDLLTEYLRHDRDATVAALASDIIAMHGMTPRP